MWHSQNRRGSRNQPVDQRNRGRAGELRRDPIWKLVDWRTNALRSCLCGGLGWWFGGLENSSFEKGDQQRPYDNVKFGKTQKTGSSIMTRNWTQKTLRIQRIRQKSLKRTPLLPVWGNFMAYVSKQRAGLGPTYCNKTFALFAFKFIPWVLLLFENTFFFHRN